MPRIGIDGPEDSTARLNLHQPTQHDLAALFKICSDPRVWAHYPARRHKEPEATSAMIARWISGWETHELDTWVARSKDDGSILGYGGCSLLGAAVWNLGYRFSVEAQGRGLATELSNRAIERAGSTGLGLPVVAYLLEHNYASAAVAEKLGLTLVHRGPDAGNPDSTAVRLIFADRPLTHDQMAIALH